MGLGWIGLIGWLDGWFDWTALDWIERLVACLVGLGWVGLDRIDWVGLGWVGLIG